MPGRSRACHFCSIAMHSLPGLSRGLKETCVFLNARMFLFALALVRGRTVPEFYRFCDIPVPLTCCV